MSNLSLVLSTENNVSFPDFEKNIFLIPIADIGVKIFPKESVTMVGLLMKLPIDSFISVPLGKGNDYCLFAADDTDIENGDIFDQEKDLHIVYDGWEIYAVYKYDDEQKCLVVYITANTIDGEYFTESYTSEDLNNMLLSYMEKSIRVQEANDMAARYGLTNKYKNGSAANFLKEQK